MLQAFINYHTLNSFIKLSEQLNWSCYQFPQKLHLLLDPPPFVTASGIANATQIHTMLVF